MIKVIIERLRNISPKNEHQKNLLDAYEFLERETKNHDESCMVLIQARQDVTSAMDAGVRPSVVTYTPKAPLTECNCKKDA